MYPVIICIAKKEHDYIEEFVKYHLALGFKHIYIYDNEDTPRYKAMLSIYKDNITVIHFPFNNREKAVQYAALDDFINTYLWTTNITHVAHIDIDEYIVLKKHNNICEFINEYIVGDCQGIGMNWRFFGSSGRTKKTNEPNTIRFTMCEKNGNIHIKTLFKKDNFISWGTCHDVMFSSGYTKSTNNTIINGPFNHDIDFNVIQLNHYKCKTLPEFKDIRRRGRADLKEKINENIEEVFKCYDINEIEDLNAYNFYKTIDINYKYHNNNNSNSKINVIYKNKMNKSLLFMFVCLPARFLLAFLAYKINLYYLPFLSIISFFIGVQFIRHYIKNEPKIGFFGSNVWWENYRLIHGIDYLLFSLAAFFKNKNAWFFLLLDAIFALIFFMYEKYLVNKDIDNTNSFNHLDY